MSEKDQFLEKVIRVINTNAPDAEVYLYGSRARGDARDLSDWDLLILLNRPSVPFDFETSFMDAFYDIELETGEVITPLIYSKKDWNENHSFTPLFENIEKEGVQIK
ncbi:nucleotidyltransferase domain-containing protein [uncultured Imperialibacter sp.]|uniref:nucleotidyltransferase domain-containing protein n=1 Tax=uncultured Imperialibacter sp. TaxID=1672639 RepID=UPI0030DBB8A7|tara:strand:- start:7342 stop:7662 length:321 start_codon:yes stop_codon:yes gene_type:complete